MEFKIITKKIIYFNFNINNASKIIVYKGILNIIYNKNFK